VKRVVVLPGDGVTHASVVVLEDAAAGRARRVRRVWVALDAGSHRAGVGARWPPAELKAELAGDLLCLEYREP
jgi:D-serine deaminase-like pyridoxal phosphate-dependent protein